MSKGFQKAITNGIIFLAKEQEKDGSFFCLVSTKLDNYKNANTVPAIVPTNIVLSSLIHIKDAAADRVKKKAASFLFKEKGEYWSFNYWFRKSDWNKKEPYPDDTDDTFVPLAALYEYKPELFDGAVMARITTMLTSAEKDEGGPYDMWLVPPDARNKWNDTDLVCNANIAYFLSLQDIYLPKVTAFLEKKIDGYGYEFPYNKIYPGIYFISRSYRGEKTEKMIRLLLRNQERDGKWENPLRTALAISSLINFEGLKHPPSPRLRRTSRRQLEKGVEYLIKTQNKDGSWGPYSFYYQMRTKKKTLFAGSPFITTALCLEAINKYQSSSAKISNAKQISDSQSGKENEIYDKVTQSFQQRFSGFSKDFRDKAVAIADRISAKNRDIVLLPFYFRNALGSKGAKIGDDFIIQLGLANLFGWIAYTIYDDFLDEEGDPKKLSIANVCLRESAEIFGVAMSMAGFTTFSKKIFDIIDDANNWEVNNCRNISIAPNYGDYNQLANKSLGHVLGPIAILFALGFKERSAEIAGTMRFFKNYIIARQLNDDAHDWEDDLKKGQVNAAGAKLLKDVYPVRSREGSQRVFASNGAKGEVKNSEKLREIFWHKTVLSVCRDISRYAERAKNDLKVLSIINKPAVFVEMLVSIEHSVEKALKERKETMKFLKTYKPR